MYPCFLVTDNGSVNARTEGGNARLQSSRSEDITTYDVTG